MSNTEDYLDKLLNSLDEDKDEGAELPFQESVDADMELPWMDEAEELPPQMDFVQETEPDETEEIPPRMDFVQESPDADEQFIDSFEQEFLSGQDEDEFLKQFERDIAEEEDTSLNNSADMQAEAAAAEEIQTDNLSMEEAEAGEEPPAFEEPLGDFAEAEEEMPAFEEPLGDFAEAEEEAPAFEEPLGDFAEAEEEPPAFEEPFSETLKNEEMSDDMLSDDEKDVMDLLQSEGDFSDIGGIFDDAGTDTGAMDDFSANFSDISMDEMLADADIPTKAVAEEEKKAQDGKKQKKEMSGFLKNLSNTLFGEEDELTEPQQRTPLPKDIENLSEEDLLLMELEGNGASEQEMASGGEAEETPEEEKARKKREKEEKKAKKKAENAQKKEAKAAEKAAKKAARAAKKASKPKKPKQPDNTPPLPKKPVILCFAMAASFLALVFIGIGLLGYSSSMTAAKEQYGQGNFEAAYQAVAGLTIKEKDYDVYEKYRIMGTVAGEYNSYQTFMEAGFYDMALDSLVRAVGRCGKYAQEAQDYGCSGELERMRTKAADALAGFGITEQRALELYALEERQDYSVQLHTVLELSGYTIE